jgi:DNA polymerase I-like protein with 3'-5' exonuclease and polymerase domains
MFPEYTYDQIKASKDTSNDMYTKGKQGFFASILYGGTYETLMNKLGVAEKNAKAAIDKLLSRYKRVGAWRERIFKSFASMQQPGGIGSQVVWTDPLEYCETFLGFRRYFTLENKICKALFDLARKPPKEWRDCPVKVMRRDRVQTAGGAVASALYGSSFAIQSANVRAAGNHEIQSPGAQMTKKLQCKVWELQPVGVHDWQVAIFQVHDEISTVTTPEYVEPVRNVVNATVESFREKVPLIGMEWKTHANTWADK